MNKYIVLLVILVLSACVTLAFKFDGSLLKYISTNSAPKAIGPYSQAVADDNYIFLSGQIAINPKTNQLDTANFQQEVTQVLENLKAVLESSESNLDRVAKVTVYMTDLSKFEEFNQVYAKYFSAHKPARETVEVHRLPKNAHIEISVIAKR